MQASYPILIHSAFYKILRESSAQFRTRVRKTLLRLRDGQWGGGTQVKRLAGIESQAKRHWPSKPSAPRVLNWPQSP